MGVRSLGCDGCDSSASNDDGPLAVGIVGGLGFQVVFSIAGCVKIAPVCAIEAIEEGPIIVLFPKGEDTDVCSDTSNGVIVDSDVSR